MHRAQMQIEHFHDAMNLPIGNSPEMRRSDLRASLIIEEAIEFVESALGAKVLITWEKPYNEPDFAKAIDALCDLLYVVYGTGVEWGIDLQPFFDEVHRANMRKVDGPTRKDGKKLKPEGWVGPDIERILDEQLTWQS